jgi:hypothetical protein
VSATAERVLAQVRRDHRRRDWRWPAALAALLFVVSSLVALFTITRQRDAQNQVTAALLAQVERLEARAASAEARAADAAQVGEANARLLENNARLLEEVRALAADLDAIAASTARREAERGPVIDKAIRRILDGIEAGNATTVEALAELRTLLEGNAELLARLDRLEAEAEANAAAEGRRPGQPEPAAPLDPTPEPEPEPPRVPTTTTTTAPPVLIGPDGEPVPLNQVAG